MEGDSINVRMTFSSDDPMRGLYLGMVESFTRCIVDNTEPVASGYDGLENLRVANAILESSCEGKVIKITR